MPGLTPGNPISTLPFEKNQIFRGANHVSDAFQLRFSFVSASFQTLEIKKIAEIFLWSYSIRVPQSQSFGQHFGFGVSAGKNVPARGGACPMSLRFVLKAAPAGGH